MNRRVLVSQNSVLWSQEILPLQILVDSGGDNNFIDSGFLVIQVRIPTEIIALPRDVDGEHASLTVQSPSLLYLKSPATSPSLHSPVVLCLPRLKLHNLYIDWSTGSIVSWSVFCHSHCLQPCIAPGNQPQSSLPELPDLFTVPPEYQDLGEVFIKQHALLLPPHRPYECAIDLPPGAPFPTSILV